MRYIPINTWDDNHPNWNDLKTIIEDIGQTDWVNFHADWHLKSTILVAEIQNKPVGFLRYVIQNIGAEEDLPAIEFENQILKESKILAFGVLASHHRQGIGRSLQQRLIKGSHIAGCYQIRSHSSIGNSANHRLKISMGYGIHPLPTTSNKDGFYFVMPLKQMAHDNL